MGANDTIMLLGGAALLVYVVTQTDILQQLQGGMGGGEEVPPPTEGEGEEAPKEGEEGAEGEGAEGGEGEGEYGGMGPGGVMVEHGEGYGDDDDYDPGFMDPNRREYRDLCLSKRGCVWLSAPGKGNSFCSCNPNEHRRIRKPMAQSQCFRLGGFWNGRYCTYYVPYPYGHPYPQPVFPPRPPVLPRPGYPWYPWHPYATAPPWWYDPRAPSWWRGPWPYRPGYRYGRFRPPPGWRYRPRPGYPGRPGYPAPIPPRPYPGPRPGYPPTGAGRVCTPYRPGNPEWITGKGGKCCEQRRSLGRWTRVCWEYGRNISLGDAHRTPSSLAKPNGCIGCPPPPHPPSPNVYPGSGGGDAGREDRGDPPNVAPETPSSAWGLYY